jgi:predicted nucleic acid-binding protein
LRAYFDASAVVSIIASDVGWEDIARFLDEQATETCLSDFGWGEAVSALGNRVRRSDMTAPYAQALLMDARIYFARWTFARTTSADIDHAADMISDFSLSLKFPDAIHIATARRLGFTLVSSDIRQVRAAISLGVAAINPLPTDGTRP